MYLVTLFLSTEAKHPVHEANHSPPCSAEIKNAWNGAVILQSLHVCILVGAQSKAWVSSRLIVGIVGSNLAAGIDIRLLCLLCT